MHLFGAAGETPTRRACSFLSNPWLGYLPPHVSAVAFFLAFSGLLAWRRSAIPSVDF
jgi:hypothetical protein